VLHPCEDGSMKALAMVFLAAGLAVITPSVRNSKRSLTWEMRV
jgi:hypothetical protein